MDRYSLTVLAMLVTSYSSGTLASTTRDAEKVIRAEYLKLCNFYLIRIPTELYESTSMDGCRENPRSTPLDQIKRESDEVWAAVDSLGEERARDLRAQYTDFHGPVALTTAVLRKMSLPDLCQKRHDVSPEDETDVLQEIRRRKAYAPGILRLIENEAIAIGMAEDAVYCALGRPNKSNRTVYATGIHKQLVYDYRYVYLENGRVVSWQD